MTGAGAGTGNLKLSTRNFLSDLNWLVPVLAVAMEVLWSYSWLIWVTHWPSSNWTRPPLDLISSLALAIGVGLLVRLSLSRDWPLRRVRWAVLGAGLLLLLVLLRLNLSGGYGLADPAWFSFAATRTSALLAGFCYGLFLIWRGISANIRRFTFPDIYQRFLIGLTAIIILLVIWGITVRQLSQIWSTAGTYVIAYFGLGLLTLAVVNLESLRSELSRHQEAAGGFKRRWLSMLIVIILAILGIGAALTGVFSGGGAQRLLHILSIAGNWLLKGLYYILLPVGYVIEGIIFVLRWLIALLRNDQTPPEFNPPDLSDLTRAAEGQPPIHIPEALLLALKWGGLALLVGLILFFLSRSLIRYWEGKSEEGVEESHQSIGSWSMLRADLRGLLSWLFRRFRRKRQVAEGLPVSVDFSVKAGNEQTDLTVRELYRSMLWQGRELGLPRRPSATPNEYAHQLKSRLELPEEQIDAITDAYVADRYGEISPGPSRIKVLNRLWRSLRQFIAQRP